MKTSGIIYFFIFIIAIIFAIIMFNSNQYDYGAMGEDAIFGADFYTIINENASRIADNTKTIVAGIRALRGILCSCFGYLFLLVGFICLGKSIFILSYADNSISNAKVTSQTHSAQKSFFDLRSESVDLTSESKDNQMEDN